MKRTLISALLVLCAVFTGAAIGLDGMFAGSSDVVADETCLNREWSVAVRLIRDINKIFLSNPGLSGPGLDDLNM